VRRELATLRAENARLGKQVLRQLTWHMPNLPLLL
jgi:hypothetical protein